MECPSDTQRQHPCLAYAGDSTCLPRVDAPERVRRAICTRDALQQQRPHPERRRLLGGCLCDHTTTRRSWLASEHNKTYVGLARGALIAN